MNFGHFEKCRVNLASLKLSVGFFKYCLLDFFNFFVLQDLNGKKIAANCVHILLIGQTLYQ